MSRARDLAALAMYRWGPRWVQRTSRHRLAWWAARTGDALVAAWPDHAALLRDELLAMWPEPPEPADVLVRRALQCRVFDELEVLSYAAMRPDTIDAYTVLEGQEHLDVALARGRGVLLVIPHYGANQMVMPALGHRGYRIHQLSASPLAWAERREAGRVNPLWRQVQERRAACEQHLPAHMIDVFGFLRPAYTALRDGNILCVAFDGGGGRRWVRVPLGARHVWVSTQPWQLARSTGATVVPALVRRHPRQGVHRIVLRHPMELTWTDDREADVQRAAEAYAAWFGRQLAERPDPYLHFLALRRRVRATDARPFVDDPTGDA